MIDTTALREKVLDLAIRGKLVPQDPNDEPASVLLERIREQKKQMVKEGKLKAKDIKDDSIIYKEDNCYYENIDGKIKDITEEIPFDLPNNWSWCRLNLICPYGDCEKVECKNILENDWILELEDIEKDSGKIISFITKKERPSVSLKHKFYKGQLLYSKLRPYLNKVVIAPQKGFCTSEILPLSFYEEINPLYMQMFLMSKTFLNYVDLISYGVKMPRLGTNDGKQALIALPPLNEQKRISNKFLEIIPILERIKFNQTTLLEDKELLKSKILEFAIQGKLVPQDENDEPASVLLERIRAERKAQLGKKYVESYIYKGDDNCYYENNLETNIEIPFELPLNWAFTRLHNIAWLEDGEKIHNKELPYLDARTLRGKQPPLMITKGELVNKGTNVILVDGENSGEVFEVPYNGYMGSTFKVLKVSKHIEKGYIKIILDFYRNLFRENKTGAAIPHLNKKLFKNLIVALPPAIEQIKILEKINNILSILKDEG